MSYLPELDKKIIALNDIVVIGKIEKYHQRITKEGIIIPESADAGGNLCKGKVESIGPKANKEKLKINDIVLFDHFSTFGETYPICMTKIENIICILDENNNSKK